jgi:benzoyl-CoA reductase/2-hydroxyglutaryl-CoA dehydratase subunit BcrC/BadD/HgdB
MESFYFEKTVKKKDFRLLKIETDFSKEDKQNILTRLEAFKETLG